MWRCVQPSGTLHLFGVRKRMVWFGFVVLEIKPRTSDMPGNGAPFLVPKGIFKNSVLLPHNKLLQNLVKIANIYLT